MRRSISIAHLVPGHDYDQSTAGPATPTGHLQRGLLSPDANDQRRHIGHEKNNRKKDEEERKRASVDVNELSVKS